MHRPAAIAIGLAVALLSLGGCGGSSGSPTDTAIPTSTGTVTAPVTTVTTPTTGGSGGPPKVKLVNGVYTPPDKSFTFRPNAAWDSADDGGQIYFATNTARTHTITISGESLDGAPSDLKDYVTVSLESAPDEITGFKMGGRTTITLPSGDTAERLEYTGSVEGSPVMHFLTLVSISKDNAVTATFATPTKDFASAVGRVETVLRTIDVR